MNTSDLEGIELDLWVARAIELSGARIEDGFCWVDVPADEGTARDGKLGFMPSTDWTQGGRVIERLRISTRYEPDSASDEPTGYWYAHIQPVAEYVFWGATPLVAAMRAAVHWKYGDDVPDAVNCIQP